MAYVNARYKQAKEELAYKIYVTEAARALTGNIAAAFGGNEISGKYWDLIHPKKEESEEAIIKRIREKIEEA